MLKQSGREKPYLHGSGQDSLSKHSPTFSDQQEVEVLNKTELNGPSDVTDDFSACANADQEPDVLL